MKCIILLMLLSISVLAQTEYRIEPGTKNNEIILVIVNESEVMEQENIRLSLVGTPNGIDMKRREVNINCLASGEEREVSFPFDAKRIPTVKKDTLRFLISDNNGRQWEKKIVLVYDLPTEYKLEQNYPNPFNPSTVISYQIPVNGKVTLKIIDILGREVTTLVDDYQEAGYYEKIFDARGLSSGVYFSLLQNEKANLVRKMLLVK